MSAPLTDREAGVLVAAQRIRERQRREEQKAERAAALKHLGKCYRFRNSYGCGDKRGPWWLYFRVDAVDKHGGISGLMFETDNVGHVTLKPSEWRMNIDRCGYQPITATRFNRALRALKRRIGALKEAK